jgi:hypothetical protein
MQSPLPGSHRPLRLAVLAILVALAPGCSPGAEGGRLEGNFLYADSLQHRPPHRVTTPVLASWCPRSLRLEVTGIREDLGIGLVVYPVDSLVAGSYPVFDPGLDSSTRPGAAAAVRWFDEQTITGTQSDSGTVEVTLRGARIDLRFGVRLRSLDGRDTIRMRGQATGLTAGRCPADSLTATVPRQ